MQCLFGGITHRCGITVVPAEEKAAIIPDSRKTEDALSGIMKKRWEICAATFCIFAAKENTVTTIVNIELNTHLSPVFFYLFCIVVVWNRGTSKMHYYSMWTWHQSTCRWVWWKSDLRPAQGHRGWVCLYVFLVSCMPLFTVFIACFYYLFPLYTPGGLYKGHVDILAPTVRELANLEREAQTSFLKLCYLPNQLFKAF